MPDTDMTPGMKGLVDLINAPNKRAAQKLCRDLLITGEDFFNIIVAGRSGLLEPYQYACHFSDYTPPHVPPTAEQMSALSSHGKGQFTGDAARAITRIGQVFKERRLFAAHLFYLPEQDFWSLFYFDQRDRSRFDNHWNVGGPHIHYCCEAFTQDPLENVWQAVCQQQPRPPSSEHIRYVECDDEG